MEVCTPLFIIRKLQSPSKGQTAAYGGAQVLSLASNVWGKLCLVSAVEFCHVSLPDQYLRCAEIPNL